MARVVWTKEALAQLELIRVYIHAFDPAAAQRMARRLMEAGDSLREYLNRGRPAGDERRELPTIPPYVIRYEIRADTVFITGVRHGARRRD